MPKCILFVEDDPASRAVYGEMLRAAGYAVAEAETVREAQRISRSVTPDIVVLDRALPDGDGFELAVEWRRPGPMSKVPIIALTALASRADTSAALDAGCDAFLPKPCTEKSLLLWVERALLAAAPTRKIPKYAR